VDLIASPRLPRGREVRLVAKIAFAAVLAWGIADLLGADRPVFAAIIPLVALRADDPYGAIGISLIRVLGTVLGIAVGIVALEVAPDVNLFVVAAVVVVSLVIGLFVRSPREAVSQVVAVTALIVILLGPGEATGYGLERIWETLVGAAIAIVVAMVVWPPDPIAGLRDLVRDLGAEVVRDLDRIASLPGGPVADAEELLDERVRASMSTSGSIEVLDRASSALRWNPRHRGKREAFWPLAVQVRQLLATSRYARSMVWLMVAGASGDRVPGWSPDATEAFAGALGQLAVGATAVAAGADPTAAIDRTGDQLRAFSAAVTPGEAGAALAGDLHGAVRQVVRVLTPATSRRLEGLLRDRYAG
jgi:uncharacterized membrane protein YgaE (UPF0421/DUF939 family)